MNCPFPLQLPSSMYKKVLVILHDSILPHMSKPTLMIDFLTAAYDIGENALLYRPKYYFHCPPTSF